MVPAAEESAARLARRVSVVSAALAVAVALAIAVAAAVAHDAPIGADIRESALSVVSSSEVARDAKHLGGSHLRRTCPPSVRSR